MPHIGELPETSGNRKSDCPLVKKSKNKTVRKAKCGFSIAAFSVARKTCRQPVSLGGERSSGVRGRLWRFGPNIRTGDRGGGRGIAGSSSDQVPDASHAVAVHVPQQ